jgi:hypothetical protein
VTACGRSPIVCSPQARGVAEVEAEVARLWRLNAARIGTGDPNLIYAGTALRLH